MVIKPSDTCKPWFLFSSDGTLALGIFFMFVLKQYSFSVFCFLFFLQSFPNLSGVQGRKRSGIQQLPALGEQRIQSNPQQQFHGLWLTWFILCLFRKKILSEFIYLVFKETNLFGYYVDQKYPKFSLNNWESILSPKMEWVPWFCTNQFSTSYMFESLWRSELDLLLTHDLSVWIACLFDN